MISFLRKHPLTTFLVFCLILIAFIALAVNPDRRGISIPRWANIAVIEIDGVINDSEEVVDKIISIRKSDNIRAVVIRINSPGGGVAPSQEIYDELIKLREDKKVVASLSSIAASGGYYIASAAHKIVSNAGTLTGSIGVIMDFSNMEGLLEKVGMKNFVVKSGKFKDIGSPLREMREDERNLLQGVIDNVHDQFIRAIVKGRGMERARVAEIADGRIFSGEQALEIGLVDGLGSLQESIRMASEMAGIEGEPEVFYSEKEKGFLDYMIGNKASEMIGRISTPQFMYILSIP